MTRLEEMLAARQAPGIRGVSDGPGSGRRDAPRFDFVQPKKEYQRVLSQMEEAGRLRNPRRMAEAEKKWAEVKHLPDNYGYDYEKKGHPISGQG